MNLQDLVAKVVYDFISNCKPFTAFDVTTEIRKTEQCKHYEVRDIVHSHYAAGKFGGYTRSNAIVAGNSVLLYHDASLDPTVIVHGSIQINPSVNNHQTLPTTRIRTVKDGDDYVASPDSEQRINIPKRLLNKITNDGSADQIAFVPKSLSAFVDNPPPNLLFAVIRSGPGVICNLTARKNIRITCSFLHKYKAVSKSNKYRFQLVEPTDGSQNYILVIEE